MITVRECRKNIQSKFIFLFLFIIVCKSPIVEIDPLFVLMTTITKTEVDKWKVRGNLLAGTPVFRDKCLRGDCSLAFEDFL